MSDDSQINIESITRPDGYKVQMISPDDSHPIWDINPGYAEKVKMAAHPISVAEENTDLPILVRPPLLDAAIILNDAGIKTSDSSPWEQRGDEIFAYVAAWLEDVPEHLIEKVRTQSKILRLPANGRVAIRNLPSMFDDEILGLYFEIQITPDTTLEYVNDRLKKLATEVTKLKIE